VTSARPARSALRTGASGLGPPPSGRGYTRGVETVESVEAECRNCGAAHYVIPPTLGQLKRPVDEPARVELPRVASDAHLVEADTEGRWSCRVCGHRNQAPELNLT
jgi:hypothetical protein